MTQFWKINTVLPSIQNTAIARVPNTNNFILCAFNSANQWFCVDPINGEVLFTRNFTNNDVYCLKNTLVSSMAIESLFPNDPSLYIIALSDIYRYDSTRGLSYYCSLPVRLQAARTPYGADLDLDGVAEIIYGNCIYRASDCSVIWCGPPWVGNGITTAFANFDSVDPQPEVLMVGNGNITLYTHDGTLKWQQVMSPYSGSGSPAVGDFHGDGIPDIGVSNYKNYFVWSGDGTLLRRYDVEENSYRTGSIAFDFNNDGLYEFVYCGFHRSDNCFIFSRDFNVSFYSDTGTAAENSVIADLDLDGVADLVVPGDTSVRIFNADSPWAGAPSVWNRQPYSPLGVDQMGNPTVTEPSSAFRAAPVT